MSEPSDFESINSDGISFYDINETATNDSESANPKTKHLRINISHISTSDYPEQDLSLTDSDHSLLEAPKLLNASSPSSICSTKPLEWDSGADVGYDITPIQKTQDMSTIERIAVSNLVNNANSTPITYDKKLGLKTKSNSLINLNEMELNKGKKSASFQSLKFTAIKSDTLPKYRSPMASSQSVSTVVQKLESLNINQIKQLSNKRINMIFEQYEKRFEKSNINLNNEQKSPESSKESDSTLGSADTGGSWVVKEFHGSINTTTDRVNSFEYLPGCVYYNNRDGKFEDNTDKEILQNTKVLVEAMEKNGLTNKLQKKEIIKEIVEHFLKNYIPQVKNSSINSLSDSDQTPGRQDLTSQTSNTANTIVNNRTNNHSSTITFTSPITSSSQYGNDVDSKYDESSLESGRYIDLQNYKSKKNCTSINEQKNQSVQCSIKGNLSNINKYVKQTTFPKSVSSKKNYENLESSTSHNVKSTSEFNDIDKEFKKQMIWFHTNYMKTERENQMLWINNQISHLKNLKNLLNTHEELKKNWDSYKQKQIASRKPKFRTILHPVSNTSSDLTSLTKTNSTISSKNLSVSSKYNETDAETSTTICDHMHYKMGILVDEPKSMKKCCEKTLHIMKQKQNQTVNKLKSAYSQTESNNEIHFKSNTKDSAWNEINYTIDDQLKPFSCKSSISYDIIFKPSKSSKEIHSFDDKSKQKHFVSVSCQTNDPPSKLRSSLQEYLMKNRPDYICRAEERQTILTNIASLRDKRTKLKRDMLIANHNRTKVPPNPLAIKRVMSQKEMRKLTESKYHKCPEVKNKKVEKKRKEEYKTNKIMAHIFNKKLQKKTLKGNVDLSNSVSVCSL
ncbi:ALMS motif [Cinara cedri]|uniref:ALMS motif n=1 Tax=Cinara cedri TaxID=506608 RepID=A0A5E4MCI2_9HEMI|nr:ALMS motif [Cinara cedri]